MVIVQLDFRTTFLCGAVDFGIMYVVGVCFLCLVPFLTSAVFLFGVVGLLNPLFLKRLTAFIDMKGNKKDVAYLSALARNVPLLPQKVSDYGRAR